MTPQEQYPKFYNHPERYLGIEVERMSNYAKYIIDYSFLNAAAINKDLHEFKPLFKPQQGEQFIKDLEDAVSCATRMKFTNTVYNTDDYVLELGFYICYIQKKNISIVDYQDTDSYNGNFDTSAYVDRLRELGYYV